MDMVGEISRELAQHEVDLLLIADDDNAVSAMIYT